MRFAENADEKRFSTLQCNRKDFTRLASKESKSSMFFYVVFYQFSCRLEAHAKNTHTKDIKTIKLTA